MPKKFAPLFTPRVIVVVLFVILVIAFFVIGRPGGFKIHSPLGDVSADQKNPTPNAVASGVKTGLIESEKDVTVHSTAAGGVETGDIKSAKGSVSATHTPGQPEPAPPKP